MQNPQFYPATFGLFGTCGSSRWREPFLEFSAREGISCFNPQLESGAWKADLSELYVQEELYHFENCALVVFAITAETLATVSLAEVGFSLSHSLENANKGRAQHLFVFIDPTCKADGATPSEIRQSEALRVLLRKKVELASRSNPRVLLFDSTDALFKSTRAFAPHAAKAQMANQQLATALEVVRYLNALA